MLHGKIWGTTEVLEKTPIVEVHRLNILPNMQCSMHKHLHKRNAFHVSSGRLYIDVIKNDYNLTDITTLGPGDYTVVTPTPLVFTGTVGETRTIRGEQMMIARELKTNRS